MALNEEQKAERFKSAAESAGYTIEKINGLNRVAYNIWDFWQYLADKYMGSDWDGTGDVNDGVERMADDMGESHSIKLNIIKNGNSVFTPRANGYVSPWFSGPANLKLELKDVESGEVKPWVIGFIGTSTEYRTSYSAISYNWFMTNNRVRFHSFGSWNVSILETLDSYSLNLTKWRAFTQPSGRGFIVRSEFYHYDEYTYTDVLSITHHGTRPATRALGEFDIPASVFPQEDEATIVFRISPPSYKHPGDDIKSVSSITGGNGADAYEPNPTKNVIGQGGNGGHGGGGGGGSGTSKLEKVYVNEYGEIKRFEVDFNGGIGTMTAGTGGHGTQGTAGHDGGCIIYF